MKLRFNSFRVRLILLMVLLSGSALLAFGFVTWRLLLGERIAAVDLELESLAFQFSQPFVFESYRPVGHSAPPQESQLLSSFNRSEVEILLLRQDGKVIRQSANWPAEMSLEPFTQYAETIEESLEGLRITPRGLLWPPSGENGRPPPPYRSGEGPPPPRDRGEAPPGERPTHPSGPRGPGGPPGGDPFLGGPRGSNHAAPGAIIKFPEQQLMDYSAGELRWRVLAIPVPAHVILLSRSRDQVDSEMKDLRNAFLLAMPFVLLFIAAGASWIANQAIKPVTRLSESAEKTTAQGLDRRIPEEGSVVEFNRLTRVYNEMLSRLDASFNQASRFSADAAHELNTPITILMGHLDDALQNAQPDSDEQERYGLLLIEVQRLKGIVDKLLLLSKADSGQLKQLIQRFSLTDLVEDVVEDAKEMAPEMSIEWVVPEGVSVDGDPELIRQIVFNLLSNAIKYSQDGGSINLDLTVDRSVKKIFLTVSNSGTAIDANAAEHLFDRFYRVDATRNRSARGLGLGLSLAREFAEVHKGTLELTENRDGQVAFTLALPI